MHIHEYNKTSFLYRHIQIFMIHLQQNILFFHFVNYTYIYIRMQIYPVFEKFLFSIKILGLKNNYMKNNYINDNESYIDDK